MSNRLLRGMLKNCLIQKWRSVSRTLDLRWLSNIGEGGRLCPWAGSLLNMTLCVLYAKPAFVIPVR